MTTKKITCIEFFSFKSSILDGGGGRVSYQKATCYLSKYLKTSKHRNTYNNIILLSRPETAQKAVKLTFHISKSQSASILPNHHGSLSSVECHLTKKKRIFDVASTKTKTLGNLCKWNCKKKKRQEISKPASSGLPSQVTIPCFSIPGDVPMDLSPPLGTRKSSAELLLDGISYFPRRPRCLYIGSKWIKTFKFTRAASTLNFSKSDWLLWCHFYSTLHPLKKRWFWSFAF